MTGIYNGTSLTECFQVGNLSSLYISETEKIDAISCQKAREFRGRAGRWGEIHSYAQERERPRDR